MKNQLIRKEAILHALSAVVYIALIAALLSNGERLFGDVKSALIPVGVLMLLTLSVAVMGIIFFGKPAMLYVDGKKKDAIQMLVCTIMSFAVATIVVFAIMALL